MKKILLLSLLVLVIHIANAQKKYDKLWKEIESLELEGKFQSANEIVGKVLQKARQLNQGDQIVKSFIYKSKFTLLLEEEAQSKIISELESEIKESDFPTNAILESIYAEYLEQYLERHRYKIRKRTKMEGESQSDDFEKWDINTLISQIARHYDRSIFNFSGLRKISINEFQEVLTHSKTSHKFRPTLYDFLVHRALEFYQADKWDAGRPKEKFICNNPVVFAPTQQFIRESFYTIDSIFSNRNVLKLYQQLESFHQSSDTTAYVDVVLERLQFAKQNGVVKNKNSLYREALLQLSKQYENHESSAIIDYQIANFYFETSEQRNAKNDSVLKDYRIKALHICLKVLTNFPNSDGGVLCTILKNKIEQQSISIETEKYIVPDKPFLAQVRFKSADSLYVSAYRVPINYLENKAYYKKDSLALEVIKNKDLEQSSFHKLQAKKDFYEYTTEIDLPSLPIGTYLLVASKEKSIKSLNQIYSYDYISVTNLSMLTLSRDKHLVIKILNRLCGNSEKNVKLVVTDKNGQVERGKTNVNGEFQIKKDKEYDNLKIEVIQNQDTLVNKKEFLSSIRKKSNKKGSDEHIAKMYLYLDRSIYRPGQTVYFKGLLVENKEGKSSVVPNTYTSICILDANYEEIKEFRLKTNKFGSVYGEFKLPRNILTGEFTIEMDEDYGSDEEDEDSYYDNPDDVEMAEVTFSVEEYKRPKFEVKFDEITENYRIGDSIKVKGLAKAFLGSAISDATAKYTISREVKPDWTRNFYGSAAQIIETGTTQTDSEGKFILNFRAVPDSLLAESNITVFIYTVETDITDSNGETRSASQTVRVGYHNLEVNVLLGSKLNSNVPQKIKINTMNLNNQTVDAEVQVSIHKLIGANRVLRKKPWELVELQSIPKEKYIELFPNEPYDSIDTKKHWECGRKVFSKRLNASEVKEFTLTNLPDWESGSYKIEVIGIDDFKDTVHVNRQFDVYHPAEKILSDHQMFEYEIVNSDFKKDQFVDLKLKTACKELNVNLEAYYQGELVYNEIVSISKGQTIAKIPVSEQYKNKLDVSLYFVKFNSLYTNQFSVNFKEVERELTIETLSFRNKLLPGKKETWSFKITNSDQKNADAEVLASMYDTSLDQFKKHSWSADVGFRKFNYSYAPRVNSSDFFGTVAFKKFNSFYRNSPILYLKNYHKLEWFGFNFGSSDYSNKRYLNRLSSSLKNPKHEEGNINGLVLSDEDGLPIPGVSVIIKGTNIGTTTDIDGFYAINAPIGSELVFSFVGMLSQSMSITKPGTYNMAMTSESLACDEVVVTAMGVQRTKKSLSGSFAIVNGTEDSENILMSLQGRVVGIQIQEESEDCEDSPKITIRGISSVAGSQQTMFVIDGVIMDSEIGAQLSPNEIADISVLKGASATALYGARAANGVVVISTKKGLEALAQVETRSDLKETAFFFPQLTTNEKGEVIFSFDSPQALTRWRLMLLAHNKSVDVGTLERTVVTQKNINVIPNAPRFLREGDTITFSAKISNLTKETLAGVVALQLINAVTMEPIGNDLISFKATKNFTISAKGNSSVAWILKIPKGIPAIQYKIVAKSGMHSDGESSILPVLSNRALVTEARSLWVPAGKSKEVQFPKLKQVSSQTQENHQFTLEYTSNPAWTAIKSLPYLMEFPFECAEQTFSRFYANALAEDILDKNPEINEVFASWINNKTLVSPLESNEDLKSILISESPWLRDLQNDKENKASLANLFDIEKVKEQQLQAISKLNELQLSSGGFPWFSGGRENKFITQHIVAGIGHLQKLNVDCEYQNKLTHLLKKALDYLDSEFVRQYEQNDKLSLHSKVYISPQLIHYLYARSFFGDKNPLSQKTQEVASLYFEECKKSWLTQSLYCKGMIALLMQRKGQHETARLIIDALNEQAINNEENGMYWKENTKSWYWYQSPVETQALLIEAFTEIDGDLEKVEQLKQHLLKSKQSKNWGTTKASSEAIYALLMHGNKSISITDNTVITIGNNKIKTKKLEPTIKEAGTGYFKVNWTAKEITPEMAAITVQNKSNSTGFGAVYWQYFEDLDQIKSSENTELSIKKSIFVKETNTSGEQLVPITSTTPIKLGNLLTVRLEITSKNDFEFVHLKDLRASGLEPIDVMSGYKWQDGLGYYQSTKDVATNFFFDELPKGTYIFEYDVRANNKGNFSNGISSIQSMYAPEFISNSKGVRVTIK